MHVPSADLSVERSSPSACFPYRWLVTFDLARSHAIWYLDRHRSAVATIFSLPPTPLSDRFWKNWTETARANSTRTPLFYLWSVCLTLLEYFLISGVIFRSRARCYPARRRKLPGTEKRNCSELFVRFVRYIATRFDQPKGLRRRRLAKGMKPDLELRSRNLLGDRPSWPPRIGFAFQCPSECDPHPATTTDSPPIPPCPTSNVLMDANKCDSLPTSCSKCAPNTKQTPSEPLYENALK